MSTPEHQSDVLRDQLLAAGAGLELSFRAMFGGIMAYAGGRPFASLSNVGIALKLDEPGRRDLLAVTGAKPLQYKPSDPPSRSYVLLPPELAGDPLALRPWLERSAASVGAMPNRPAKTRRRTSGK